MIETKSSSAALAIVLVAATSTFAFAACSSSSDTSGVADQDARGAGDAGTDAVVEDAGSIAKDGAVSDAASAFSPITVPLTGCPQAGFAGNFTVGNESFDLVVDTGSAELGVAGSACSNCTGVSPLYTPTASAIDEGTTTSVSYVSGSGWSGEIFSDSFGGSKAGATLAPTKLVAIQSQTGGFFTTNGCGFGSVPFAFQGIAGFGPGALAKPGTDEPMAALAAVGVPDIFAVALCGLGGQMWLGGFDSTAAASAPIYTPMVTSDFYAIKIDDLKIAGTALGFSATDIDDVVVDTDTTEFELPTNVYDNARDAIGGNASFQGYFGGPAFFTNGSCIVANGSPSNATLDAELPTFTIQIDDGAGGSSDVTLAATQSYLEPITQNGTVYYCPEIEPRNSGGSTVLGSSFLRSELTIFDRAAKRIGFAPYASCTTR